MDKRVIVFESDRDILDLLKQLLQEDGYDVTAFSTAPDLENIDRLKPQLVLIDDWINHLQGQQICKQLKSNLHTKHISVILLSTQDNLKEKAKAWNADAYIAKPFDIDELLDTVKRYA